MANIRTITAHFLGSYTSVHTRSRYKKDIVTWQRFCAEEGIHAFECTTKSAQKFVDWMAAQYTPMSVASRMSGVTAWFDALVAGGVLKSHGMRNVKLPKRVMVSRATTLPSDEDMKLVAEHVLKNAGPRIEWLLAMVAWGGCDCAEALRVKQADVRMWENKTMIRVRSRRGNMREIPVDGRLEVLTHGLCAVFSPTSPLSGLTNSSWASTLLGRLATEAVGHPLTVQDMRRWAVKRQFERGIPIPVISRWMGHTTERWVRRTLELADPVSLVTAQDVVDMIVVEPDGDRFGAGQPHDSSIGTSVLSAST